MSKRRKMNSGFANFAKGSVVGLCVIAMNFVNAEESKYSWQQGHAEVLPTGDLKWKPKPFMFEKGKSVKYIDFEKGKDSNTGSSKTSPWKHHPWDKNATANSAKCTGIHTYVLKKGVVYRGVLEAKESGSIEEPIRLTSDPSWGEGEASLYGSQQITKGWKLCKKSDAPKRMPEPTKVWYLDLNTKIIPENLWETQNGKAVRIPIARQPNWTITNEDDPMEDWGMWKYKMVKGADGKEQWTRYDDVNLTGTDSNYYEGARVHTEYQGNMGTPFFTMDFPANSFDPELHSITTRFVYSGRSTRYFIENIPPFLDSPGEFYYARKGKEHAGRLYLRLPKDKDPNTTIIEMAQNNGMFYAVQKNNIVISGLRFSFNNITMKATKKTKTTPSCAIQLTEACINIKIANCKFNHLTKAISYSGEKRRKSPNTLSGTQQNPDFLVCDNDISYLDNTAIAVTEGTNCYVSGYNRVKIMRNNLFHIGYRHNGAMQSAIPTIYVNPATVLEVAGNILDRCCGAGLFIFCGKPKGGAGNQDRPLVRVLIHHNKITNGMLTSNDWGGIESWECGPSYIYSNIVGNIIGPMSYVRGLDKGKKEWMFEHYASNAYAYYLDGSYKHYVFNNIAWGKRNDIKGFLRNRSATMMVGNYMNYWYNNTIHKFLYGFTGAVRNRCIIAGNLISNTSKNGISMMDPKSISVRGGGFDTKDINRMARISTLGFSHNVFHNVQTIGGPLKKNFTTIKEFQDNLGKIKAVANQVGILTKDDPLVNSAEHNFAPNANSAGKDNGVKPFIPWSLFSVVGEWSFCCNNINPEIVIGENLNLTPEYVSRKYYSEIPQNDLSVPNAKIADYAEGVLESWSNGALVFDGKTRFAIMTNKDIKTDYKRSVMVDPKRQWTTIKVKTPFPGNKRKTVDMNTNNFLIEAYFKTQKGNTNSVLVNKGNDTGYELGINGSGCITMLIKSKGKTCELSDTTKINDGNWHHVIGEVNRQENVITIYIDGKQTKQKQITSIKSDVSLSNTKDFLVGKNSKGNYFAGELEFLRISQGTLTDANTTIEELYAWQFDGPPVRDFMSEKIIDGKRDAGAIEYINK